MLYTPKFFAQLIGATVYEIEAISKVVSFSGNGVAVLPLQDGVRYYIIRMYLATTTAIEGGQLSVTAAVGPLVLYAGLNYGDIVTVRDLLVNNFLSSGSPTSGTVRAYITAFRIVKEGF